MPPQQSTSASRRYSIEVISSIAFFGTLIAALWAFIPSSAVPFIATKTFLLVAGTLITLILFIVARLARGNVIFPPMLLVGALWLPGMAYLLASLFSGSFMNSLWGSFLEVDTLGFMIAAIGLGTLAALIFRRPEQYRSFLRVGAWVACITTLVGAIILIVGQFAPNTISPAFSVIGSFNDFAFLLGLGVIGTLIASRFIELSLRARRFLFANGVVALGLLAVANSTTVWTLVALVALGLFVEAVMRRGSKNTNIDLDDTALLDEMPVGSDEGSHSLVLPLGVLVVSLFFLIGGTLGGALANTMHVNTLNIRPSWQSTFNIVHKTYSVSPIFGSGPGTFGADWLKYRDTTLNATPFWNMTFSSGVGLIPTSFATTGLIGMIAWIAFLGLFFVLGLRMLLRRAPQDAFVRFFSIFSFLSSLYLFTIAFFDLPGADVLVLAFVFAGLFISTMRFAEQGKQWGVVFSRSPRIGFVIVFSLTIILLASVAGTYSLTERYIAASELLSAQTAFSSGKLDEADRATQKSISFAQSSYAYQTRAAIAIARLNEIAASSTLPKAAAQQSYQSILAAGINDALTATSLTPSDPQSWIALGNLYAQAVPLNVSGAYSNAKVAYEKAKALDPTNPQIPYIIAQLDIANRDGKAAEADLQSAITLKQDYTDAILLLSQLEVQEGNVKDALSSAIAAAYFEPNNPNILFQVGILSAAQGDFTGAEQALSQAVAANPQFANARYFLAAIYAKQGDTQSALTQMQAISALSPENAKAVASQITALSAGTNPFPTNLFSGTVTPVKQ